MGTAQKPTPHPRSLEENSIHQLDRQHTELPNKRKCEGYFFCSPIPPRSHRIVQLIPGTFSKLAWSKWEFHLTGEDQALRIFQDAVAEGNHPIGDFAEHRYLKVIQSMTKHCWQQTVYKSDENGLLFLWDTPWPPGSIIRELFGLEGSSPGSASPFPGAEVGSGSLL